MQKVGTMKRRLMRLGFCLCIIFLAVWVALSPRVSPSLYSDKLFKPNLGMGSMRELREFNKFENHELFFSTKNADKLHGWLFLNPHSDKIVIAPKAWARKNDKTWYKDIVPSSWIRL